MTVDKVRENRARRAAERQALKLTRSRRRDPRAIDYGGYWLHDIETGAEIIGGRHGVPLETIEEQLNKGRTP